MTNTAFFAELNVVSALSPQCRNVLAHMRRRGSISPMEADVAYGVKRLASRMYELKEAGYCISSEMRADGAGHRYARYYLDMDEG